MLSGVSLKIPRDEASTLGSIRYVTPFRMPRYSPLEPMMCALTTDLSFASMVGYDDERRVERPDSCSPKQGYHDFIFPDQDGTYHR